MTKTEKKKIDELIEQFGPECAVYLQRKLKITNTLAMDLIKEFNENKEKNLLLD